MLKLVLAPTGIRDDDDDCGRGYDSDTSGGIVVAQVEDMTAALGHERYASG
jgi:hypothetical protein